MKCGVCQRGVGEEAAVFCPGCAKRLTDEKAQLEEQLKLARIWAKTWYNAAQKAKAEKK